MITVATAPIFTAMKQLLHQHLTDLISSKLKTLEESFLEKRESLLSESKSTAGDKHETGRAMIQLEQEKLSGQMLQLKKQLETLTRIRVESTPSKVQSGSLVTTNKGTFYLAIGIGQLNFEGKLYFCIAPTSPIGQAMLGKSAGESFSFNNLTQEILKLE